MTAMKTWLPALLLAIATSLSLAPSMADAKRLGGGGSAGLQRSLPTAPPAKPTAPANPQQAAPSTMPNPAGAAAAAAPKRNWLGPVAGLAAGLGLAALMSHLGLGEEFASILMLALLAMVAFVAIRFVMGRMGRPQPAAAGAGARIEPAAEVPQPVATQPMGRSAPAVGGGELSADGSTQLAPLGGGTARAGNLPADFDADGFARIAKTIFIRLQAANDAGDLNDLRSFTTPEMFAVARLDIQDRGARAQTTDVVQVDAEVLDFEQEGERQIVSVRFHGKIREEADGAVADFDEVWHLQRWSHDPNWKIAGIQQTA
jgi:predicted lipid-binding transport protein (Tim44 family)